MAGVNYDEAIHKVYSRKKAAIAGTLSAAGFFFFLKAFFWQGVSKLNICVLQQQETVCEGLIKDRYELHSHGPVCIYWYVRCLIGT